jgi:hypothetical protein
VGLREVISGRRKLKGPAPDRLFAISTAYVDLQAGHGIEPAGTAAIVFQALATSDFESTLSDMEALVRSMSKDAGTSVESREDDYGYRWLILRPGGVEDLAVGINAVSGAIETAGYGERLLCAVFAFVDGRHGGGPVYLIYNYKRGSWYPFVPRPGAQNERIVERELQIQAQIGADLPLETELERWFPLWGIPL